MFGYRLVDAAGQPFKIAKPEKLLLDYMYLHSELQSSNDFESLRINQQELQTLIKKSRLLEYLTLFENKALEKRVSTFMKTFHYA